MDLQNRFHIEVKGSGVGSRRNQRSRSRHPRILGFGVVPYTIRLRSPGKNVNNVKQKPSLNSSTISKFFSPSADVTQKQSTLR